MSNSPEVMSPFAAEVMQHKYSHTKKDNSKETWEDIAARVPTHVFKAVDAPKSLVQEAIHRVSQRQFIPGGRYLYASGRPYHQTQNCYEGSTRFVTRDGVRTLREMAGRPVVVMTTGGAWTHATVQSFGEQPLMKITLRRAGVEKVLYATPEHSWRVSQRGKQAIETQHLCEGDRLWDVFGYGNWNVVSVEETDRVEEVFCAVVPDTHEFVLEDNILTGNCLLMRAEDSREGWSQLMYNASMGLMSGAGIGIDYSQIRREGAAIRKTGGTATGPLALMQMINEAGRGIMQGGSRRSAIWAGLSWKHADIHKFIQIKNWPKEVRELKSHDFNFPATLDGTNVSVQLDDDFFKAFHNDKHSLHAHAQSVYWATIERMLKTGEPGFSIDTGANKGETLRNAPVAATTVVLTQNGPRPISELVDTSVTVWTGKQWANNVVFRRTGINVPVVRVEMTGGREIIADPTHPFLVEFSAGYETRVERIAAQALTRGDRLHVSLPDSGSLLDSCDIKVVRVTPAGTADVYCADVHVEEHSFMAEGVIISNCTEVSSHDDSDICNLGSINLARIESLEEFATVLDVATAFLLAGTVYSDVPYAKVDQVRTKNRRLGLGLMGIHEWLAMRGKAYGPDTELEKYLELYTTSTGIARQYAEQWDLSCPIKTRAIAPTGTIGIIAETTTGIEPIFCAAYKRRYLKGKTWNYQYVVDPTAKRLVEKGIDPDRIEDAYSIECERRVAFQAWTQQFVDHGISSTINLPAWGTESNNSDRVQAFGTMLMSYLPKLRGITCYPDGARGGQPLSTISYRTASKHVGEIFVETMDVCDITRGGSCGA